MNKRNIIVGIDAGSETSGIIVLAENRIEHGYNLPNSEVVEFIYARSQQGCKRLIVIVEDVRPYSMRITDGIIRTIKFLGELEWRLKSMNQAFTLIPRWSVKQWVFIQFKTLAWTEIEKKITRATNRSQKKWQETYDAAIAAGDSLPLPFKPRKATPTFVYVDDRIVANAMRKHWSIKNPSRVGQRAAYGLKDHSWQALGLVSYYMALNGLKINKNENNPDIP